MDPAQISESMVRSFGILPPVEVDRHAVRQVVHPKKHYMKAQLDGVKEAGLVRKQDMRVWSATQVLKIDHDMRKCVQAERDRVASYIEENVKINAMVDVMTKRLDGETGSANIDAAVDILKMRLVIGQKVRARLDSDIYTARSTSLRAMAALNKLGPQLAKSTMSITIKIRELETQRRNAALLFAGSYDMSKRSRL